MQSGHLSIYKSKSYHDKSRYHSKSIYQTTLLRSRFQLGRNKATFRIEHIVQHSYNKESLKSLFQVEIRKKFHQKATMLYVVANVEYVDVIEHAVMDLSFQFLTLHSEELPFFVKLLSYS